MAETENTTVLEEAPVETPAPPEEPAKPREGWLTSLQSLCGTVCIALFVITFLVQAFQIPSESMQSTLLVGDYLLVDKVEFAPSARWLPLPYERIQRGDIIVFKYPVDPNLHFVKRVIGLPGDRIRLVRGHVIVDGQWLKEDYTQFKSAAPDPFRDFFPNTRGVTPLSHPSFVWLNEFPQWVRNGDLVVPEGHYFVLGDNRNDSSDSRYWGFVPRENIIGRPLMIYFSVGQAPATAQAALAANDKIDSLTGRIASWPSSIRWKRTFRFVK
ncbi:MAG: signal peptidase I [Acidobacteriales bacterium]|nr:signal peptidase I [Terriglobales bacterium]